LLGEYSDTTIPANFKGQLQVVTEVLLAFNTWFFTFGIIGFFLKFFNRPSRISRYLSDGSYWIYLIHMPMVIYFQSLLLAYNLPVFC
jgi:peptidoglycan/LPS O-acetylase OafA/YrhL